MHEIGKKLNLGAGEDRRGGYVNVDWNKLTKPDIVHDLNAFPYPFKDNEFEEIIAVHVLEHLDKPFMVMKELHRLLKPGGTLLVRVPHFSRGFTHAEHSHGFDISFPKYFDKSFTSSGYIGVEYQLISQKLHWMAFFHLLPYYRYSKLTIKALKSINRVISFLANINPLFCSRIWCFWVGGFEEIEIKFKCEK